MSRRRREVVRRLAGKRHAAGSGDRLEEIFNFWRATNKVVIPKLELGIFDQLDECDEQTPRMRTVDDEALQENARDLLLNGLQVGFGEEIQQSAREIMRVRVGITQLIGDGVEEQISAFRIEIDGQVLENVHVRGMGDGGDGWSQTTVLTDVLNGLSADVEDESVQQRDVVTEPGFVGKLQVSTQVRQERDGSSGS